MARTAPPAHSPDRKGAMMRSSSKTETSPGSRRARCAGLGVVLFTATLCLTAIGTWSGVHTARQSGHSAPAHALLGPGGVLAPHARPSESLVSPSGGPPPPAVKDRVADRSAIMAATVRAVRTASIALERTTGSSLMPLRRCALLFPTHFFW